MSASGDGQTLRFPTGSGVFFSLGLSGFFDGIVLHQVLQWHRMLSSWYPTTTIENLRLGHLLGQHLSQHDVRVHRAGPLLLLAGCANIRHWY